MSKKLSLVGLFCIGLMAFWASSAYALNLSGSSIIKCPWPQQYNPITKKCQSPILVDLSWGGIGNADKTITDFIATLTPRTDNAAYPFRVLFRNPGGNTGGTASVNFDDSTINPIQGGSNLNDFLTGKGKANTKTIFGDCDNCEGLNNFGELYTLPDDGKLWFLLDFENACGSQPPYSTTPDRNYWLATITCIKENLVEKYSPGAADWWPFAVEIDNLNLYIEAYTDGVPKLIGDFQSCKINSENEYICDTQTITKVR